MARLWHIRIMGLWLGNGSSGLWDYGSYGSSGLWVYGNYGSSGLWVYGDYGTTKPLPHVWCRWRVPSSLVWSLLLLSLLLLCYHYITVTNAHHHPSHLRQPACRELIIGTEQLSIDWRRRARQDRWTCFACGCLVGKPGLDGIAAARRNRMGLDSTGGTPVVVSIEYAATRYCSVTSSSTTEPVSSSLPCMPHS